MFQHMLQMLSIYYTSSYFFLLLLFLPLDSRQIFILRLAVNGGGKRGVLVHADQLFVRVITLGVERSCSKLELKTAIMETLNTLKHEYCRR